MDFDLKEELLKSDYTRKHVILSGLCKTLKEVDELTNKIKKSPIDVHTAISLLRPKITAEDIINNIKSS